MLRAIASSVAPRAARALSASAVACKRVVRSDSAPKPIGPFSQGIVVSAQTSLLFASGCIPTDPATGKIAPGSDVQAQTEQVLKNLGAVLSAGGASYSSVVKTTVFLSTMDDFARMNEVYARYFGTNPPARSCVAVKGLPMGALVEVEAVAEVNA